MDAVSYDDLIKNLGKYMSQVYHDHDPLIVTRENQENVVLISMDEYNSLLEVSQMVGNEANEKLLLKSIIHLKVDDSKFSD